jgi:APA family basic amino acid/polyamine antiporter
VLAIVGVILFTGIHAGNVRMASRFQNVSTGIKLMAILVFIAAGFVAGPAAGHRIQIYTESGTIWGEIFSDAFATSLFYIFYAYSGWNTSAYIAGEIDEPQRNLPRSLFWGTLSVTLLYVLLNFIFLYTTPSREMAGQNDIGYIAAQHVFGNIGGKVMGLMIALILVSSISALVVAGPRVAQAMGQDIPLLRRFAGTSESGVPVFATVVQSAIALLMILTSTFEQVMTYIGFTLNLFTLMTVTGLIVLRWTRPEMPRPYKAWGYPFTPILFLILGLWPVIYALKAPDMRAPSLFGLATMLTGLLVYFLGRGNRPSRAVA